MKLKKRKKEERKKEKKERKKEKKERKILDHEWRLRELSNSINHNIHM